MSLRKDLKRRGTPGNSANSKVASPYSNNTFQYEKQKRARPMLGDRKLLIELEKEYEKKKNNSKD